MKFFVVFGEMVGDLSAVWHYPTFEHQGPAFYYGFYLLISDLRTNMFGALFSLKIISVLYHILFTYFIQIRNTSFFKRLKLV